MNCPLELTGQIDLTGLGLGCVAAEITSGTLGLSGSWTLDRNGHFEDNTTTKGTQLFEIPAACGEVGTAPVTCDGYDRIAAVLGFVSLQCVDSDVELNACTCSGVFEQSGGLAAISYDPLAVGTYSIEGAELTTSDGENEVTYEHCVTADAMVLSLPSPGTLGQVEGLLVMQRQP